MEVVIKIPDKVYEMYKSWEKHKVATVEQTLIAHGTVLPKGHGDLIDTKEFDKLLRGYGLHYEADTFLPMANVVLKADT